MTPLRVATFNIRNGLAFDGLNSWPFRRQATADAIRMLDADVVGLQEVFGFQRRWLERRLSGYAVEWSGRRDGRRGESCPLFLRGSRVALLSSETRWFGDAPDIAGTRLPAATFPRLATICRLQIDGVECQVANTHLDEAVPANRARSAELLMEWLDPTLPRVVLGDLNAAPDDPALCVFADEGYASVLPGDAGGTNHDFSGRTDGARIDHIFVSGHFSVLSAGVRTDRPRGRLPSDHWPVVADLELRGESG